VANKRAKQTFILVVSIYW